METKTCLKCTVGLPLSCFSEGRNVCNSCRLLQIQKRKEDAKKADKVIIAEKPCTRCLKTLKSDEFNKNSYTIDGLMKICRACFRDTRHRKKEETSKADISLLCEKCKITKPSTEFRTTQRSKTGFFKTCNTCWKPRVWNKEKQKESEKKYVSKNIEKIRKKWQKTGKQPNRILRDRLNHRISSALKSTKTRKDNTTINYIGCDIPFLKKWIEYQFDDTIGWHNYGDWHLDHVMPCASFDLF